MRKLFVFIASVVCALGALNLWIVVSRHHAQQEGETIVRWVENERQLKHALPATIEPKTKRHWWYRIDEDGAHYGLWRYYFARRSIDYSSKTMKWQDDTDH